MVLRHFEWLRTSTKWRIQLDIKIPAGEQGKLSGTVDVINIFCIFLLQDHQYQQL